MSEAGRYAPRPGRIPGVVLNLGGCDLVLAPLNLDGVQAATPLLERFNELAKAPGIESMGPLLQAAAEVLHLSLVRNYTDMTPDDVRGLLDVYNAAQAVEAMATQSGFKRATPGEIPPAS